ncbi:MAG TPA: hypothetical protein VN325_10610 [Steroidobacteraceae bacterium]|nr:hypothetical protein [Steroidobacteraceae bacterium]
MGSTYVDLHGQGFEASDATLQVWLLLLVDEIDRLENPPQWLKEVGEEWYAQGTAGFGFGVMPGLDQFVTGPECRDAILDLSAKAMRRLRGLGPMIPVDQLNAIMRGGEGTVFTEPVSSAVFEKVGDHFVRLLRGELSPEETDARF